MGYDKPDVYHQPEHFGLKLLASAEFEPDYDFDIFAVWKHEDGRLFCAEDAGCSCPSPFEDYTSLDDLFLITDYDEFVTSLDTWKKSSSEFRRGPDETEIVAMKKAVAENLPR